jgi:seryl-tRNA synthetase
LATFSDETTGLVLSKRMAQTELKCHDHGWNEYKRLVLAELERLNQAVEKLREQSIESDKQLQKELHELRQSIQETLTEHVDKGDADITAAVEKLEAKFSTFKSQYHKDDKESSSWGFWGAIVGMITSLIVAIISLIVTLWK